MKKNFFKNLFGIRMQFYCNPLSAKNEKSVLTKIAHTNVKRIIPFSAALIVSQILLLALQTYLGIHKEYSPYFFALGLLSIVTAFVFMHICRKVLENGTVAQYYITYRSFWTLFFVLTSAQYILDTYVQGRIASTVFLYIMISVLPIVKPAEVILFLLFPTSVYAVGALLDISMLSEAVFGAITSAILCAAGSYILFVSTYNHVKTAQNLEEANRQLVSMSMTDSLTGVANRWGLEKYVHELWKKADGKDKLSVLMVDIDFFKNYNDTYGHYKGDACLCKIASVLQSIFNFHAGLVSRVGGEEFMVLLENTSSHEAKQLAEQVRCEVEALKIPSGKENALKYITVSVGVTLPEKIKTKKWEDFFIKTDRSLYAAKNKGRNNIVCA